MSSKYYLRIVQYGQAQQPHTLRAGAGREGKALVLQAQSGMRFQLMDALTQEAPSKLNIVRQGQDLLITLPDGDVGAPDVVIRGYFDAQDVAVMGRSSGGDWRVYDNTGTFSLTQANGISPASLKEGQATTASMATPPGESWFSGEKGWVLAGVGALGLVAGTASLSKHDNTTSGVDKIKAFAEHVANAATPTVTDYANAGFKSVDANNVAAINSALLASQLDMSVTDNVQKVVDSYVKILAEANGSSPDATQDTDPTVADYQNLGVLLGSLQGNPSAVALLNDAIKSVTADNVDTVAELKAIVAAVQKVMNIAAGVSPASALTTDDLVLLGIRQQQLDQVHAKDNLSSIVSAIGSTPVDGSGVSSVAKLLSLMTAYDKILTEANGSTPDADVSSNPTVADFAAIGAAIGKGSTSSTALSMLDDVIGAQQRAGVDTVDKINGLAVILDKLSAIVARPTGDGTAPTLTATEFGKLGLTGFASSGANNQAVADLLNATVRDLDPGDVDTLAKLQALASLDLLRVWAKDPNPTKTAGLPTLDDYTNIGVVHTDATGSVVALSAADATTLNGFVDNLNDAQLDSLSEVRQVAGAVFGLLNEANGTNPDSNTADNPTAADYVTLGVTGHAGSAGDTLHAPSAQLLTDVVATKTSDLVDTPKELNALAAVVDRVVDVAAGSVAPSTLAQADFATLSITGVTASNLTLVGNYLQATADDGTGVDSLAEIQSVVSLARVVRYADDANVNTGGTNDGGLPTLADYKAIAAVQSIVVAANVNAYNNALDAHVGSQVDDPVGELLPLIRGYNTVLSVASGATPASTLGLGDFSALGVNGVTASNLAMLGSLIQATARDGTGVDTLAELQSLTGLARVAHYADDSNVGAGGSNEGGLPTLVDYKAITAVQSNVVAANVNAYNNAVDAHVGSQLDDATAELLPLIRSYNTVMAVAAGASSPSSLSLTDFTTLGVTGVTSGDLSTVSNYIQASADDGSDVDTLSKLQSVIALGRIVHYADDPNVNTGSSNAGGLPTLADYKAIAAVQSSVVAANIGAYNSAVDAHLGTQIDDVVNELLPLLRGYNSILTQANGTAADPVSGNPTVSDYAAVGVNLSAVGTVPVGNLLVLMNQAIGTKSVGDVDTVAEVEAVRAAAAKVMGLAAINKTSGASDSDSAAVGGFTLSDLSQLGLDVSLLTQSNISDLARAHRLADVRDHIVYSDNTGSAVEFLSQLQALVNATAVIVT